MTVNLSSLAGAGAQFLDNNGVILSGGKLYSYVAGTTTPQTTYTNASGSTAHTNPIILNSAGRVATGEIWLTAGENYKFSLFTSSDVLIATYDNITGINGTGITSNAVNVTYDPAGTGAVATTVQAKLREEISIFDFLTALQIIEVKARTASFDCLPAFNAAKAAMFEQGPFVYPVAGKITFPKGLYYFSDTMVVDAAMMIEGEGSGKQGGNYGTTFSFPVNTTGIYVTKGSTGPNENGGDGSIFSGLYVSGVVGSDATKHGLRMCARMVVRDCTFAAFSGDGINIDSSTDVTANANVWRITDVALLGNGRNGLFTEGPDSNAGYGSAIDAVSNAAWGINDSSFLGNTYVGCHVDGNGKRSMVSDGTRRYYCVNAALAGTTTPGTNGAVWVDYGAGGVTSFYPLWISGTTYLVGGSCASLGASAWNVFIGCYAEVGSQPPADLRAPSISVGGFLNSFVQETSTGLRIQNGSTSTGVLYVATPLNASIAIGANAGGQANSVIAFTDPDGPSFKYRYTFSTGRWSLKWADLTDQMNWYTRAATPANGYARDLSGVNGGLGFPSGYYGPLMKYRGGATAIPTSGNYIVGDILYDTAPAASGFIGWVCVTAGTPGTWKTFGAISA